MAGERADPEKRGVIPNSFDHIFSHIAQTQDEQYLVRVSYLEIYKVSEYMSVNMCSIAKHLVPYFSVMIVSGGSEGSAQ